MQYRNIFIGLALFMSLSMNAGPITRQQARQQAQHFMSERGKTLASQATHQAARRALTSADDCDYYYVFNAGQDEGYVIVSGDDRTAPVLGYVDHGTFDENGMPDGLRWMLQTYREQMDQLDNLFASYETQKAQAAREAGAQQQYSQPTRRNIEPLLPMLWNQGDPYNLLCPRYYNEDGTLGGLCATGCVATALAQVVGYYRWPEKLKRTIPGYVQKYQTSQGEKSVTLRSIPAGSVIDWDNILDTYNGTETDAQKQAIAELMYWVGMDCKMSYGASSASGYSEGIDGLVNYFDFDDETRVEKRGNYSIQGWNNLIYNEIATGHPVPFGGQNSGGGHAFVLDGYDVSGLFHVNWGWGGMSNGYFRIDILDPDNTSGIGASQTPGGYNMGQDCIIGMKRPDGVRANLPSRFKLTANDWEVRGTNKFFANYVNWSGIAATWNFGIGYVNDEGKLTVVGSYQTSQINQNYYVGMEFTVRGLPKGSYHIVPISKRSTDTEWGTQVCADVNYVLAEVDDNGNVTKMEIRPTGSIEMTSISFPGNHKRGDNQVVSATFKNHYSDEVFKEIHLLASQSQSKGNAICRTAIGMLKDGEATISLSFKPEQNGTWNVWLSTDGEGRNIVGQGSFEVTEEGVALKHNLRYVSHTVSNRSNNTVYGNRMQGRVNVRNQAAEPFNGQLKLWLFKLASNGYFYGDQSVMVPIQAEPGKTGTASYYFDNLELNATYVMSIIYEEGGDIQDGGLKTMGRTQAGVVYWQQNQTLSGMVGTSTFRTPSGAVAVDMSGLGNVITTVQPNNNKNTLYVFGPNDAIPAGLEECNVVKGNKAERIVLTDSLNFFSPLSFTAAQIFYSRQAKENVWETIALPFAPDQLAGPCTVMGFSAIDDNGQAVFSPVEQMERNVPYLVGSKNGGLLTFSGTDVRVASTINSVMTIGTDDYWLVGSTLFANVENVLGLNENGTAFEPIASLRIAPFRAYFKAPADRMKIETPAQIPDGVEQVVTAKLDGRSAIYDLQGRRVAKPGRGLYIRDGRKYVIR